MFISLSFPRIVKFTISNEIDFCFTSSHSTSHQLLKFNKNNTKTSLSAGWLTYHTNTKPNTASEKHNKPHGIRNKAIGIYLIIVAPYDVHLMETVIVYIAPHQLYLHGRKLFWTTSTKVLLNFWCRTICHARISCWK